MTLYKLCNLITLVLCINFSYIHSENHLDPKSLLPTPTDNLSNTTLVSNGLLNISQLQSVDDEENGTRAKRNPILGNHLLTPPSAAGNSVEGLLASCQLTNLLLYQLLQQKSGTSDAFVSHQPAGSNIGNNILQPFPVIQNSFTTITSTSTYVTTKTSTDIITIPLLFGNKPSPTTVTRTKTYEVTTSEVRTITTTIPPIVTSTVIQTIQPTLTVSNSVVEPTIRQEIPEVQDKRYENGRSQFTAPIVKPNSIETIDEFKPKPRKRKNRQGNSGLPKAQSQERKKIIKLSPGQTEDYYVSGAGGYDQYSDNYPQNYHQADYGTGQDKEQIDYLNNHYARRLKRRGEAADDEEDYEREYLLEPSYDASNLDSTSIIESCPPPQQVTTTATITLTKTVTKFVNPPASIISNDFNYQNTQPEPSRTRTFKPKTDRERGSRRDYQPPTTQQSIKNDNTFQPTSGSSRIRSFKPSRNKENSFRRDFQSPTTTTAPTTQPPTRNPQQRRGRSREAIILARNPSTFAIAAESQSYAQSPAILPDSDIQRTSLRNSRSRSRFSPTGYA